MRATHPTSNLWDWPFSRTGQASMALLGIAIVMPFLVPLFLWITPFAVEGEETLGWIVVPVLIAAAAALLAGILALVAIILKRERSLYLAFPLLGALIVVFFALPGA